MSTLIKKHIIGKAIRMQLNHGDITEEKVDAIVNAANSQLRHGGGVAGIIARKGGKLIDEESREWVKKHGLVAHDKPAYTNAGNLHCKYVIHAVGPVWGSGDEEYKLAAAVFGSLKLAEELSLESIAIPAISTGIFGYPNAQAAEVIYNAVKDYFLRIKKTKLKLVRIIVFDQPTTDAFLETWEKIFRVN